MKKLLLTLLFISIASYASAEWRTCVGMRCSQTQATFDSLAECADFERYQGGWESCFRVDEPASSSFRTCLPLRCSQEQETFSTAAECIEFQEYKGKTWAKCFDPKHPW